MSSNGSKAEDAKADGASPADPPATPAAADATVNTTTPSTSSEQDKKTIATLEEKVKEFKNELLRALADAENLRERTRREKELAQQLAIKSFAKDLISVADILDIALESVPEAERTNDANPQLKNLYTGLTMTRSEMTSAFKRHGLEPFDPIGQVFDPNQHQALFQAPMHDKEPGTVFTTTKKGYMLHGIVLRAAQVGVVQQV